FKRATKLRYTRTSGPVFSPATLFIIAHATCFVNGEFSVFSFLQKFSKYFTVDWSYYLQKAKSGEKKQDSKIIPFAKP
uniref:hypothetical protein n=1 Tax=uncultured Allofournierella sp. TaxID=1940258 RepID=UPI0025FFFB8C